MRNMATARVATTIRRLEKTLYASIVVATLAVAMAFLVAFLRLIRFA
jgi:cell division protein FtsL